MFGNGARLVFDSANEVMESVILAGVVVSGAEHIYTYNPLTQTCTINDDDFKISKSGTELTYLDLTYKYKAF